jgi:hypothetical protein
MLTRISQLFVVVVLFVSSSLSLAQDVAHLPAPSGTPLTSFNEVAARLDAIEKAVALQHDDLVRVPTQLDRAVTSLKDLISSWISVRDERFQRIDKQFEQDAKLREQLAIANSTAIAAALQAAEKAVVTQNAERIAATAKSDAAFAEQLKQLQSLTTASIQAIDLRLADLKDRVTRSESLALSAHDTKSESRLDSGLLVSVGALAVAGIAVVYSVTKTNGSKGAT